MVSKYAAIAYIRLNASVNKQKKIVLGSPLVLRGSWTSIRTSPPNLRPGLDYTLVEVWTRALYIRLVLRDLHKA